MAQKATIPDQYLPQPCGTSPRITVFTNSTNFMFLIWTFYEPKRKPRYKTIRGLQYECGRQWHLPNAICIPQMNIPTNKYHVFPLPSAPIGTCGWYVISDACKSQEATSFSPPIKYCYVDCPPTGAFCQMQRVPTTLLGSDYSIAYRDVIAGNPNVRVNDIDMKTLAAGTYVITATATVRADPNAPGSYTGEMWVDSASEGDLGHSAPFTSDRDQEIPIAISVSAFLPANDHVTVKVMRTAGTNLLQTPASLNAFAQWTIAPG